jgi:DNA polymerase-1
LRLRKSKAAEDADVTFQLKAIFSIRTVKKETGKKAEIEEIPLVKFGEHGKKKSIKLDTDFWDHYHDLDNDIKRHEAHLI